MSDTNVRQPLAAGGMVTFKYDPFGRRIYKSLSSTTSVYAYDGDNLIEETNATGGVVARYAQTQNIDEPLAMLPSSTTSYFHADGLGFVISLSEAAGSIANAYTHDSFGKLTASTGSLVNPFHYAPCESDPETGLYYYRARYYDPSAGRFLSEDPIGLPGGDLNFYRYVWGRPLGFRDSLGWWGIGGIAGGSVGLGAGNFIAGSAFGQFGYFRDKNGQSSAGWAGSYGGGAGCPCENSPSLVPNNGSTPTALGAWAGVE